MLTPFYSNLRYWFYGVGNTPAINVLCDTRFRKEYEVKILLLGCGDARNILYTTWQNADQYEKLNFTVCDTDPAVLARNITLFAGLLTKKSASQTQTKSTWNTYYHFYITNRDETYLLSIIEKLLEASTSLGNWKSSPYGAVIKFSGLSSLERVRVIWQQHHEVIKKTGAQKRDFQTKFQAQIQRLHDTHTKGRHVYTGFRAASPKHFQSLDTMASIFQQYWTTGVIGGNQGDVAELKSSGSVVNPLLAVSSAPIGDFAVHYGTDPAMSFHLAEVFDSDDKSSYPRQIVKLAKEQFGKWSQVWAEGARAGKVCVSVHCGDAIALCHKIQARNGSRMPLFTSLWRPEELVFDESLPKKFDVIDTSNLADSVGLLAILPAAIPLLEPNPAAMIYTETLLQAALTASDALKEMLCCDPTTMFAILGIAPVGYLTKVSSSVSGGAEVMLEILTLQKEPITRQMQFLMRIPWKYPASGDSKVVQAQQIHMVPELKPQPLARLFFCVYQKMFAHENLRSLPNLFRRQLQTPLSADLRFYTRASFAIFLALIKARIRTDWGQFMQLLVDEIMNDRSMPIGSNQIQELLCWLHLTEAWDDDFFRQPVRAQEFFRTFKPLWLRLPIIFQPSNPPHIVFVAMAVPRKNLDVFHSSSMDKVGTPGLHISIAHEKTGMQNCFFAINGFFGKLGPEEGSEFRCRVEIDNEGWKGNSDLIVTCAVPIYTLMLGDPRDIQVCLEINVTPITTLHFVPTLGPFLRVFQTRIQNGRVKLLKKPPGFAQATLSAGPSISALSLSGNDFYAAHLTSGGVVKELTQRSTFAAGSELADLLSKDERAKPSRSSPCSFVVQLGSFLLEVLFHYPLFGIVNTIRHARRSLWIELAGPIHSANRRGGYDPEHFPVIVNDEQPMQWSLSNVDLGKLRPLPLDQDFSWLPMHLSTSVSAEERSMIKSNTESALLRLKQSIFIIFWAFTAIHPEKSGQSTRAFLLVDKDGNFDTAILAKNLLYDPDTASVVLDAQLICLTKVRSMELDSVLVLFHKEALKIQVLVDEQMLWKHLLPALVERCRLNDWEHCTDCPYILGASMPLSTQQGELPICVRGENQSSFEGIEPRYAPMGKYATRIALAPLAAVSYVENLGIDEELKHALKKRMDKTPTKDEKKSSASACDHCGKEPKQLKRCSRCQLAKYCNRDCQQAAWKGHKKACEQARRGL